MRSTLTFPLLLLLMACAQSHAPADGTWSTIVEATTIGYKRILRIDKLSTSSIRVVVDEASHPPLISNPGLYLSSEKEREVYQ